MILMLKSHVETKILQYKSQVRKGYLGYLGSISEAVLSTKMFALKMLAFCNFAGPPFTDGWVLAFQVAVTCDSTDSPMVGGQVRPLVDGPLPSK